MTKESQITQLEKRARGFRRIISSLNDLPMYGINRHIDKILHVKIDDLKEHLKKKITRKSYESLMKFTCLIIGVVITTNFLFLLFVV